MSGAGPSDTVLDVACGAGLVVCAFAAVTAHATGIDVTSAMIERAFYNLDWELETVLQGSSLNPGALEVIRDLFREDLTTDRMSVRARLVESRIWFTYPIVVLTAVNPHRAG